MKLKNINKIYVAGDFHGEIDIEKLNVNNFPEQKELEGTNILIQVGDFGFIWKNEEEHKRLKSIYEAPSIIPTKKEDRTEKWWLNWLDKKNFFTLFIGGNHENYNRLEKYPLIDFCGGKAAQISTKVFYLQNGYIYDFDGLKFWMFGGATSIDKDNRIEGLSWWPQEIPSYSQMQFGLDQLKENNYQIDYIITHTLPKLMIERYAQSNLGGNFHEKAKLNYVFPCPVSSYLNNVFEVMRGRYKRWYAGHFHFDAPLDENITVLYQTIRNIK